MNINLIVLVMACAVSQFALAEQGDWVVRTGFATVSPNASSDGIAVPALGIAPIPGTEAEPELDTQLGLTVTYFWRQNLGIELLASTPFAHKITADLDGFSAGLEVDAAEVKQLPPTLSLIYYPFAERGGAFQPYAGIGVNYTLFFSEDVDSDLEALTGTLAGAAGPVDLDLDVDDSIGLAYQLGFDYRINSRWNVNAAIRYINIETDATFKSALGDTITVKNIEVNPIVYQLTFGYTM